MDDAELAVVIIGSAAGKPRMPLIPSRSGQKGWLNQIRVFRPFLQRSLQRRDKNCKAIAVMDRTESFNDSFGPLGEEVFAALYRAKATLRLLTTFTALRQRRSGAGYGKNLCRVESIANGGEVGKAYRYLGVRG
jgi:pyruvate ferredoxin oxidoreductase alpha subunit